jgi:hypothetical protein
MTIVLNGSDLTVTQVIAVARQGVTVRLAEQARTNMTTAREIVMEVLHGGNLFTALPLVSVSERNSFLIRPNDSGSTSDWC